MFLDELKSGKFVLEKLRFHSCLSGSQSRSIGGIAFLCTEKIANQETCGTEKIVCGPSCESWGLGLQSTRISSSVPNYE